VIVLLHGLTDSPRQFEVLAYLLHADGNAVYVPRLPEHGLRGGSVGALSALTAARLRGAADSIVNEARGLGDSIVIVGLSMGATMGAWIAQERHVTRAVLIAPAIEPGLIPSLLDRPLIGLADRLPNITRRSAAEPTRPDREAGFNLRATAELFELGRLILSDATREAPRTREIVLLLNAADRTVKESSAEVLAHDWSSHGATVRVFELPDSLRLPHNVLDPLHGRAGGDMVLELLRALANGQPPTRLVRKIAAQRGVGYRAQRNPNSCRPQPSSRPSSQGNSGRCGFSLVSIRSWRGVAMASGLPPRRRTLRRTPAPSVLRAKSARHVVDVLTPARASI
jgi:carboxylesterase